MNGVAQLSDLSEQFIATYSRATARGGIGSIIGFLHKFYPWIAALQIGSAWVAVARVWGFPRRYSFFHGLAGRLGRVPGEKRIFLYGYFFGAR